MKVILIKDVPKVGARGDVKTVKPGYFRNFLMPQNLAVMATQKALARIEKQRQQKTAQQEKELTLFKKLAEQLNGKSFALKVSATNEGVLFAGIHKKEVAELLRREEFKNVLEDHVELSEPIKKTGSYTIPLKFDDDIKTEITLEVIAV